MKRQDDVIALTKEQKEDAASKIEKYIADNFEVETGNLQARIFLDFITENIGVYYYNKAVADSFAFITERTEDLFLLMKDER